MTTTLIRADNTSGYRGVYPVRGRGRAATQKDGKKVHLGLYDSAEEAARAYAEAAPEPPAPPPAAEPEPPTAPASIGQRIRERRLALGLSAAALADATGLNRNYIYHIENGRYGRTPSCHTLALLSRRLGTTIDYLWFGEGAAQ